jgi:hypothetical protein
MAAVSGDSGLSALRSVMANGLYDVRTVVGENLSLINKSASVYIFFLK